MRVYGWDWLPRRDGACLSLIPLQDRRRLNMHLFQRLMNTQRLSHEPARSQHRGNGEDNILSWRS